jgi:hypothetical protein
MGCGEGGWRQREWEEETGRGSGLGDQGTGFKVLGKAKGMFGITDLPSQDYTFS